MKLLEIVAFIAYSN